VIEELENRIQSPRFLQGDDFAFAFDLLKMWMMIFFPQRMDRFKRKKLQPFRPF
jgi:hypothetical protein